MTNSLRSLLVAAVCLLPSLGQAATVTLNPTADAYVQAGANANINFGNVTRLRSQTTDGTTLYDYESYLKFDTVTATGQITSAKLRLYSATSGVGSVAVTAHGVADTNWNESTITWNNKPARGTAFGTAMVSGTSYIWREIDVTDHILQERNAGRSLVSLGLANTASSSVYAHANSRNAEFNWPELVIVTAANVAPTVSLTAPANGASYTAPASISLTANASDSDGSITKVEFYNGQTVIEDATLVNGYYVAYWGNLAAGSYSLTAKATDNAGAVTTSTAVNITVTSPPPPPPSVSLYYLYADHLNTPRVATDSTNKVVWRWDSDAFGTSTANEDPDGDGVKFTYNPRFPGQYFDKETNLHYNYFRDYEPSTGRYVQSDPIGLAGGLNTYGYVGGNPLSFTDPLGLWKYYGNWCGPDWTGGLVGQYDPKNYGRYAPPVDPLDITCMNHDICYSQCRRRNPCDKEERAACMTDCDRALASSARSIGRENTPLWLWMEKNNLPPVGSDAPSCGCTK